MNNDKHLDMMIDGKYSKEYLEKELIYYHYMLKDCNLENDKVILYSEKINFIKDQLDKINNNSIKTEFIDEQYKKEDNIRDMLLEHRHWKEKNDLKYPIDGVYMNDETGFYKFNYDINIYPFMRLYYVFNLGWIYILSIKDKKIYPNDLIEMYLIENRNYMNVLFEHHPRFVPGCNLIEIDLTKGNDINITIIKD